MFLLQRLWAVLVVLVLITTPCWGHDLKILAGQLFLPQAGERTTIYLSWGHSLPVDELIDAETVERYDLLRPDGATEALAKSGRSLQAVVAEIKTEGLYQAIVGRRPAIFTIVLDKDGNRLMRRGPKAAVKEGTIDHGFRSQQFGKALIVAGNIQDKVSKPVGLPLEIVPLAGPAEWRTNRDVSFRVLLQGQPLPGESLTATFVGFRPDDAWCYATATGNNGVATVRPRQAGTWILRVRTKKPAAGSAREQYDFESFTSTLALEILP